MDAQEKEVNICEKDEKNCSYKNEEDEVNIEELSLQDNNDGRDDDDVCITEASILILGLSPLTTEQHKPCSMAC